MINLYFAFKIWELAPANDQVQFIQDKVFEGLVPFVGYAVAGLAGLYLIKAFSRL